MNAELGRIRPFLVTVVGAAALVSLPVKTQPYRSKTIEFVLHTVAGDGTDAVARTIRVRDPRNNQFRDHSSYPKARGSNSGGLNQAVG